MSASVNLPLHHKVQKFSYGTGSPGWSWKKGHKTGVVWCVCGVVECFDAVAIDWLTGRETEKKVQ